MQGSKALQITHMSHAYEECVCMKGIKVLLWLLVSCGYCCYHWLHMHVNHECLQSIHTFCIITTCLFSKLT